MTLRTGFVAFSDDGNCWGSLRGLARRCLGVCLHVFSALFQGCNRRAGFRLESSKRKI